MMRVALFITCLVDTMRPSVGWASVRLLEGLNCEVVVPLQSCCGQPNYNGGDRASAKKLALQFLDTFEPYDAIVAPSGSCASMTIKHYCKLYEGDPLFTRFEALAAKTFELTSFLAKRGFTPPKVVGDREYIYTYHDSCSCLRELEIEHQPRALMAGIENFQFVPLAENDVCCGFGGTFSAKYGDLSTAIVDRKVDFILASGANLVLSADLGCLLNIAGRLQRRGSDVQCRHIAEVLWGDLSSPAIGQGALP